MYYTGYECIVPGMIDLDQISSLTLRKQTNLETSSFFPKRGITTSIPEDYLKGLNNIHKNIKYSGFSTQ